MLQSNSPYHHIVLSDINNRRFYPNKWTFSPVNELGDKEKVMTSRDETKQASSQPAKWIRVCFPLGEISPLGK